MNPQPPVTRMRMAARTSSAERTALVESPPAATRIGSYAEQWKSRFEGTDWVPWLILALAALLRFFLLGIKPPHFDEGINGWFVDQVMKNGFLRSPVLSEFVWTQRVGAAFARRAGEHRVCVAGIKI